MSAFAPHATLLDRARSLARSHLRLTRALDDCGIGPSNVPMEDGARLAEGLILSTEVADQLASREPPAEAVDSLTEMLDERATELRQVQRSIFDSLQPQRRQELRHTMLRVLVSDEDLETEIQRLHRLQGVQPASERSSQPMPEALAEAEEAAEQTAGAFRIVAGDLERMFPGLIEAVGQLELGPDEEAEISELIGSLVNVVHPQELVADMEVAWRKEQEDKPLSLRVGLKAALRKQPAGWVAAIYDWLALGDATRKGERIEALVEHLSDPQRLGETLDGLGVEELDGLRYLMAGGGWRRCSHFGRRFGTDANDGWFWADEVPESPLGRLRLHGLVYVGRARINGKRWRVAVIPKDLRPLLDAVLIYEKD